MADPRDTEIAVLRLALEEARQEVDQCRHDLANARAAIAALRRLAKRSGVELPDG